MLGIAALWLGTRVRDHDFEKRISETTLAAEQLHKDNLTLQTNLEREKIARLQLEAKVKKREEPRVVPDRLIADILLTAPPAEVILQYHEGSPESRNFAADMHEAFLMARWKVLDVQPLASITERGFGRGDFTLVMRNLEDTSPHMRALEKAIVDAGFKFSGLSNPTLSDNTLRLIINPRP